MKTILMLAFAALMAAQTPSAPAAAQPIDFTQLLTGPDEKPLPSQDPKKAGTTLLDVSVLALEAQFDDEKGLPDMEKFKLDELARKIYREKMVALPVEDITLIKKRIGKAYGPMIVGAAWRLLDPSVVAKSAGK